MAVHFFGYVGGTMVFNLKYIVVINKLDFGVIGPYLNTGWSHCVVLLDVRHFTSLRVSMALTINCQKA